MQSAPAGSWGVMVVSVDSHVTVACNSCDAVMQIPADAQNDPDALRELARDFFAKHAGGEMSLTVAHTPAQRLSTE
jgi:hypothetical protein